MRLSALALLAALPASAQVSVDLRALPAPAASPAGLEGLRVALAPIVLARPVDPQDGPDAAVRLPDIFNRNWEADSFPTPDGPVRLGTHFDQRGNAYLSVIPPHAMVPTLYKYEKGMRGAWQGAGDVYDLSLDVSIFRARTANFVVVKRRSDGAEVYRGRIRDLLLRTYPLGQRVDIADREYRVFFSYAVLPGKPAHVDTRGFTLVFVTNASDSGDLDFHSFIIPFGDLAGGGLVTYQLYDGAKVRMRFQKDAGVVELYLP